MVFLQLPDRLWMFQYPDTRHFLARRTVRFTAHHIGNFLRRLALPKSLKDWSLRTMREKLVKIGAMVVSHARYVTFQMAEVLVSRILFYEILERIKHLKPVPIGYD